MNLISGNIFDNRYRLLRKLGESHYAELWYVEDIMVHLELVIKVFYPASYDDLKDIVFRLGRDFKRIYNINHPNLVKYNHFDVFKDIPYLVMPYYSCGSAETMIDRFTEKVGWKFIHDVSSALSFLHSQQPAIIHQALKPENVLIDRDDFVVTDYYVGFIPDSFINGIERERRGGHPYSAPEMFTSNYTPSKPSDIWALGATLYELLTGHTPFGERGGLAQSPSGEFPEMTGPFSDALKSVVKKCLSFDPNNRPKASDLERFANDQLVSFNMGNANASGRVNDVAPCKPPLSDTMQHKSLFCPYCRTPLYPNARACPCCHHPVDAVPATRTCEKMECSPPNFPKASPSTARVSPEKSKSEGSLFQKLFGKLGRKDKDCECAYSSIFAPAEVKRNSRLHVQVFLHLQEEAEMVKDLAKEASKDAERRGYIPLEQSIKIGEKIEVHFEIKGETLLMHDKKSVVWQGAFKKCNFDYFVPKDIKEEELFCVALITVGGIPIGEMSFVTKIVESPRSLNSEITARKYNKVFVSYAHEDEPKVRFLVEGLKLQGVDYFFDRDKLQPGDLFPQVIHNYINSADLFVLCWSQNASKSEYVEKERLWALQRANLRPNTPYATKLSMYLMSIAPYADLPIDMKDRYHFGVIS